MIAGRAVAIRTTVDLVIRIHELAPDVRPVLLSGFESFFEQHFEVPSRRKGDIFAHRSVLAVLVMDPPHADVFGAWFFLFLLGGWRWSAMKVVLDVILVEVSQAGLKSHGVDDYGSARFHRFLFYICLEWRVSTGYRSPCKRLVRVGAMQSIHLGFVRRG